MLSTLTSRSVNWRRIKEHALFWLMASLMLTFFFGASKPTYWWAFLDNLMYLPIHMTYFYVIAYWVLPRLLFQKKYIWFGISMVLCIMSSAIVTRILDITFIDPKTYAEFVKTHPGYIWDKIQGSFITQLLNVGYFANAAKGINLVIWTALTVKFFKMWHERRQAALQAELNFLKAQVHPHFLLNTLNNLYTLSIAGSAKAPTAIASLSEILKYMLYETRENTVSLKRDIESLQNYVGLEKLRHGERLELNMKIQEDVADLRIAPLLLIPIIENAFEHSINRQAAEAWVNIDLSVCDSKLKLKVSNSRPATLVTDLAKEQDSVGLANVKKRSEMLYPKAHQLRIYQEEILSAVILEIDLDKHIGL